MKNYFYTKITPVTIILVTVCSSIALLIAALYFQWVKQMQPCPLCIIQRYVFCILIFVGVFSLSARRLRLGAVLGVLTSFIGSGIATYHVWIQAHPGSSCGIDPLETALNNIPFAQWLPALFQADGLCSAVYPPILWLSIPQWSLVWFLGFLLSFIWILRRT